MKSFDDRKDDVFPEESDIQHKELVTLLRKAYPAHRDVSQEEHEQILARVRGQLLHTKQAPSLDEEVPVQEADSANSSAFNRISAPARHRRNRGFRQALNALAAVLVVGVLISGWLVLFSRPSSQQPGVPSLRTLPSAETVTVVSSAGGLEMSMSLTAGPYFLSEMLAADIALVNKTSSTYYVGLPFTVDPCGYASGIEITGGSKPYSPIPIATDHSCPASGGSEPLKPGQTLTVHSFVPLTSSGEQTLTAETSFSSRQRADLLPTQISVPLEKHWPSLQINASPTIPPDRQLSFKTRGSQVIAESPAGTPSHLVYLYDVKCQDGSHDGGETITGNYGWAPIATNKVSVPGCPGKNVHWRFAFGSPGYGITMGSYP